MNMDFKFDAGKFSNECVIIPTILIGWRDNKYSASVSFLFWYASAEVTVE